MMESAYEQMIFTSETTVGALVADDFRTAGSLKNTASTSAAAAGYHWPKSAGKRGSTRSSFSRKSPR